jgi:glycerophosphoryl diester phosphodiesterase
MDWLTKRPIAHRGLHSTDAALPENSTGAFQAAIAGGYPIELDVRLSRNGQVVVFHDDGLLRLTGDPRTVAQCSLEELQGLRLLGTAMTIPTMTEVLDLVGGAVPVMIELKNNEAPGPLEERLLAVLRGYSGDYAVQSFNPLSLGWFTQNAPEIPRGQLSGSLDDLVLDDRLKTLLRDLSFRQMNQPHFIAYELGALPHPAASAARSEGLPLIAWTVRSAADLENARAVADNFIFESVVP